VAGQLLGTITTTVAGNSFFYPFFWDGVHYFTVTYDAQGRATTAKEWSVDNLVRFSWEGDRLVGLAAFHGHDGTPYYTRSISYSGSHITSEEYSSEGHSGHIKYVYANGLLTSAKIEDGGVHDGKTWVARLGPE
jgi:hypothetical protein